MPADRQVGRLRALENAIDVSGSATVLVDEINSVGDQATFFGRSNGGSRPLVVRSEPPAQRLARDEPLQSHSMSRLSRHWQSAANAVMARSISPVSSRKLIALTSIPTDGATD